jgi:hypothetical protein
MKNKKKFFLKKLSILCCTSFFICSSFFAAATPSSFISTSSISPFLSISTSSPTFTSISLKPQSSHLQKTGQKNSQGLNLYLQHKPAVQNNTENSLIDLTEAPAHYLPISVEEEDPETSQAFGCRFTNGFLLDAGVDSLTEGITDTKDLQIGTGHSFALEKFSEDVSSTRHSNIFSKNYHVGAAYELSEGTQLGILCRSTTDENDKIVYQMAIGGSYQCNDQWQLKLGTLFDSSANQQWLHKVNILQQDQAAIALGLQYWLTQHVALDAGYTYIVYRKDSLSAASSLFQPFQSLKNLQQSFKNQTNRLGLKVTWRWEEDFKSRH